MWLGQRAKADAALAERADGLEEMAQRPSQPIQPPNDQRIPVAKVVQGAGQLRAVVQRAARVVGEDPLGAGGPQRVEL